MSRSSSTRKLYPAKKALKRLINKLQSQLTELRNRTDRILTSFVPKTPSYQHYSHYKYISDHYKKQNVFAISDDILDFKSSSKSTAAAEKYKTTSEAAGKEMVISYSATTTYKRPPLPRTAPAVDRTVEQRVRKKKEAAAAPVAINVEQNVNSGYKVLETLEDAWREVVARSPQIRPVEDRTAEEYVYQFQTIQKADMSIVEMLARGSY